MSNAVKKINKVNPTKNYSIVSNEASRNNSISHTARSILQYVLSFDENYHFYVDGIAEWANFSRRNTQNYLAELRKAGHAEYIQTGMNCGYYVFYELPKAVMRIKSMEAAASNEELPASEVGQPPKHEQARKAAPDPEPEEPITPEELEELEAQPEAIELDKPLLTQLLKIKTTCYRSIEKRNEILSSAELSIMDASFHDFVTGLTTKRPTVFHLMNWLEVALKKYHAIQRKEMKREQRDFERFDKIEGAKDSITNATVTQMQRRASQTAPKSYSEKMNDRSWAEGMDL